MLLWESVFFLPKHETSLFSDKSQFSDEARAHVEFDRK